MLGLEEVRRALAEDRVDQDVTTALLGSAGAQLAVARFVAEERCVVAGGAVAPLAFSELDIPALVEHDAAEGTWVEPGATILTVRARAAALLSGERVALNFLQRLCAVATVTRLAVEAVAGTRARISHTRKTTPGLRALELYAVEMGGGVPNRTSLADAILWKDNHWALLTAAGGSLDAALATVPHGLDVVVEVEDDAQLDTALAAGVRHLLVDNQPPERVAQWMRRVGAEVTVQVSGGVTLRNVLAYAEAGAHLISIGALTHSAPAIAITCRIEREA